MKRIRIDRVAMELLARTWWAAEHRGSLAWPTDALTQATVISQIRALIKRRRVQTPGDVAALELLDVQSSESAKRAEGRRSRKAHLTSMTTRQVLRLLALARGTGFASVLYEEELPGAFDHVAATTFPLAELKAEAATREHLPNQKERAALRKAKAKAAKANRARRPRR